MSQRNEELRVHPLEPTSFSALTANETVLPFEKRNSSVKTPEFVGAIFLSVEGFELVLMT